MSLPIRITGSRGSGLSATSEAHVHPFTIAGNETHHGLVTLSQDFVETEPSTVFFANSTVGIAMNQNVSFGSIASIIHSGGTTSNRGTGNCTADVTGKLTDSGGTPFDDVVVGMSVENTDANTYAQVTLVDSNNLLTLSSDIFPVGNEAYAVDAVWSGVAVQGTWNFADSGKITLTSGNNDDEASIDANVLADYDMDNFTAFTGKIDLDTYAPANTTVVVNFDNDGVLVGNTVNLDDFIDTGNFAEQSFVIPKAALGLAGQVVNGLTVKIERSGGAKPTLKLDDLQLESSGTPLIFSLNVDFGKRFHIEEIVFAYADLVDGSVVNGTMPGISYDKILGLTALTNGFIITRSKAGKTLFSATVKTLGAHRASGAKADLPWDDDTNVFLTVRAVFKRPLILSGDPDDILTIQINDDMSGLLQFTASARGGLEG